MGGGNFVPVTMELGGKDAAHVQEDADAEHAAVNIADGAFFNSGVIMFVGLSVFMLIKMFIRRSLKS